MKCIICGSQAINENGYQREPGVDLDLCDPHYWQKRASRWQENERIGTHAEGCHTWGSAHYECALRRTVELDVQLADAQKDAARYQWLRGRVPGGDYRVMGIIYSEGGEGVDAGIDAAMQPKEQA